MVNSGADALDDAERLLGDECPVELFLCRVRQGRIDSCECAYALISCPSSEQAHAYRALLSGCSRTVLRLLAHLLRLVLALSSSVCSPCSIPCLRSAPRPSAYLAFLACLSYLAIPAFHIACRRLRFSRPPVYSDPCAHTRSLCRTASSSCPPPLLPPPPPSLAPYPFLPPSLPSHPLSDSLPFSPLRRPPS